MKTPLKILYLADDTSEFQRVQRRLRDASPPCELKRVGTPVDLTAELEQGGWDLVLVENGVMGLGLEEVLGSVEPWLAEVPVVWLASDLDEDGVMRCLDRGIWDVVWTDRLDRIRPVLTRCVREAEDRRARRLAEAGWNEGEARFRAVFDQGPDPAMVVDSEGKRILHVNEAASRMFGYSAEEMSRLQVLDLHPRNQQSRIVDEFERLAGAQKHFVKSVPAVRKDGVVFLVDISATSFEMGGRRCLLGHLRDVTERDQAEERSRIKHDLMLSLAACTRLDEGLELCLHAAVEAAGLDSGGIYLLDPQTGALELRGHRGLSEAFVEAVSHYGPDSHPARLLVSGQSLFADHASLPVELTGAARREGLRAIGIVPLCYEGRALGSLNVASHRLDAVSAGVQRTLETIAAGVSQAIARLRAEEALRESQRRLSLFFSQSLDGYYFSEVERPQEWNDATDKEAALDYLAEHQRVVEANGTLLAQYGTTRERFLGRRLGEFFQHDPEVGRRLRREFYDHGRLHAVTRERRDNGNVVWIEGDYVCIYDDQHRIVGSFGIQRDVTDRELASQQIQVSEARYRALFDQGSEGIMILGPEGSGMTVNAAFARMHGYDTAEELALVKLRDLETEECSGLLPERLRRVAAGEHLTFEVEHFRKDGSTFPLSVRASRIVLGETGYVLAFHRDITEEKRAARMQKLSAEVLSILNDPQALADAVPRILDAVRRDTGCDAVGIRLRQGEDFPYAVSEGFSEAFLAAENSLLTERPDGGFCRDEQGNLRLECTCGLVLSGRTDPANPLFTPGGSAWTNESETLLEVPLEEDARFRPRNRCIHEGFQSIALIPIRVRGDIVGLLQLNDRRRGFFTVEMVRYFEGLASSFGVALMRLKEEQAVRQSQRTLRALFDALPESLFLMSLDGVIQEANSGFASRFGKRVEECVGETVFRLVPERLVESRRSWIAEVLQTRKPVMHEEPWGERWLRHNYCPVLGSDGQIVRIVVLAVDITEARRAQETLIAEATRRRILVEGSSDGIVVLDQAGKVCEANRRFADMLGYSAEEVLQLHVWEWDGLWSREQLLEAIRAMGVHGDHFETRHRRKDGSVFDVEVSTNGAMLGGQKLVFCVCRDITTRKKAEEALRQGLLFRREAEKIGRIGAWKVSPATDYLYWTEGVYEILGAPLDFRPGLQEGLRFYHPESIPKLQVALQAALVDGTPFLVEARVTTFEGKQRWAEVRGLGRVEEGGQAFVMGTFQDITERKERETYERLHLRTLQSLASGAPLREVLESVVHLVECGREDWRGSVFLVDSAGSHLVCEAAPRIPAPYQEAVNRVPIGEGVGSCGAAAAAREPFVVEDISTHPNWAHYRDLALSAGLRACWSVPILSAQGQLLGTLAVYRDCLSRPTREELEQVRGAVGLASVAIGQRRAENDLREREEIFSSIVGQAADAIVLVDAISGRFVEFNQAAHASLGYTREEFARLSLDDIQSEMTPEEIRRQLGAARTNGELSFETVHRRRDGTRQHVHASNRTLRIRNHEYLAAIWTDISERKKAEARAARDALRTEFLLELHQRAPQMTDRELYDHVLERAVRLTDSALGFFHQLSEDQKSILLTAWNQAAVRNCNAIFETHFPLSEAGSWVDCLREQRPVVCNEYQGPSNRDGLPEGHEPLRRFMSIPLVQDGHARIIFGVGNKETDYDESDVRQLQVVANELHKILTQRETQNQLRQLSRAVEQSPVSILIADARGVIEYVNPRFIETSGFTFEEIRSRKPWLFESEDQSVSQSRDIWGSVLGGGEWRGELRSQGRDGEPRWEFVTYAPITDAAGQVSHVLGIREDVTDRKRFMEALRTSEERYRNLVEASSDWIWEVDAYGRYSYTSPRIREILGYTPEEVLGLTPFDLMSPREGQRVENLFTEIARGRRPFSALEKTNRHKNGRPVILESNGAPVLGPGGELLGYRGVDRDVTARRQLEAQFRQSQKLEAVGQLAGGVAHDFNNILAAMLLQLELLREDTHLDPQSRDSLKELTAEAQRAATLTRQLLMFSRRSVLDIRMVNLNEVIENLLKMLRRLIGERIELGFEPAAELPGVEADPGMLEQVLMNLTVNARDAMPRGGRIRIWTKDVVLDETQTLTNPDRRPGRFVSLSVADTGCGMDEATLRQIFEPFFTTKEIGRGTGLGLATVHGIVGQHKGWIEVRSEPGQGSEFVVFLPAVLTEGEAGLPRPEESVDLKRFRGSETILVVEDDASVRRSLAEILRVLGYRVIEAGNGAEAIAVWQRERTQIALLMTDMVMPGEMTGWELVERLLAQKPDLKAVISSGYSSEMSRLGRPSDPRVTYLPKPYNIKALGGILRACLRSETPPGT